MFMVVTAAVVVAGFGLLGLVDALLARWLKRRADRAVKQPQGDDTEFDDPDCRHR